ncbi:hypothetical protein Tco_0579713, partial [Tanacetum coccineum]
MKHSWEVQILVARRSKEEAIAKRNEAQALVEIADLTSYPASMALR